jgi:hypothetical protein
MSGAEAWRERVDDVLWVELGAAARRSTGASVAFSGPRPHVPPTGFETIDAFEAIGLLDADDATAWREAFGAPDDGVAVSDELRERLHAYLAELVRAAHDDPGDDVAWRRVLVILNELRSLGLLDDDDRNWWVPLLGLRPQEPLAELARPPARARFERLVRGIAGPAERRRGLRLLSVDIFEDGVCAYFHLARAGRDPDGTMRPLPDELEPLEPMLIYPCIPRLEDDIGTHYRGGTGGGGGSGSRYGDGPCVFTWRGMFDTAVPPHASRLTFRCRELAFEVSL